MGNKVIRATAHVCAFLNIDLHVEWQRRRSDRCSVAVDNLSHDRCEGLTPEEISQYLAEPMNGFPDPLLWWMKAPRVDYDLGIKLVEWCKLQSYKTSV